MDLPTQTDFPPEDLEALDRKVQETPQAVALSLAEIGRLRELGRTNLYFLIKAILGYDRLSPTFHGPVCAYLQRVTSKKKRLVLPRDFYKTTMVKGLVIQLILNNPEIRILILKNSGKNAEKDLAEIQGHFEKNHLFRTLYPEVIPPDIRKVKWNQQEMEIPRESSWSEATVEAIGVTGTAVGRHFDVIIEDDLVDQESIQSRDQIDKIIERHKLLKFLCVNWRDAISIMIGNRWGHHDLIGWSMRNEPYYDHFFAAAKFRNKAGEWQATFPEQFDLPTLAQLELNPYIFSCQMMNEPIDEARQVFKKEWLENSYYRKGVDPKEGGPKRDGYRVMIVDPAIGKKLTNDYSGMTITNVDENFNCDILYAERKRVGVAELMEWIFQLHAAYIPHVMGCEMVSLAKALGYAFENEQRKRNYYFHVEELQANTHVSKEMRIRVLQPLFARSQIHLDPEMVDLVGELIDFPFGEHDDILDTLSYLPQIWMPGREEEGRQAYGATPDPFHLDSILAELRGRAQARAEDFYPLVLHGRRN